MLKPFQLKDGQIRPGSREESQVLVFVCPDEDEKRWLVNDLKIDEHTLNSALDPDELSRLEFEPEHTALIYKQPKNYSAVDELVFKVSSVGVFLFAEQMVIVLANDTPLFEGKQFNRIGSLRELLLKMIFRSIFHFLEHLKIINMITDSIEHKINLSMGNKYLINLFSLEKSLVYYINAINSNSALVERLKYNAVKIGFAAETLELLDDIGIENSQCYRQAEIYSNILAGLMDARASIVNNNLNTLIKRLTIISIVFMPLNIIAGIGGMSEFSMMTKNIPWPVSYTFFTLGLVGVGYLTYFLIRNMGAEKKNRREK